MTKLFIIFIYTIIILILEINNECSKEEPIYTSDGCQIIYCDEDEFQNGDCIIDNSIMKIQWLNKINLFGNNDILINSIEMPNNDIFFICSDYTTETIYIYGLKSSGEAYFNDNEENFREINLNSLIDTDYINSVGLIIDNKQYIFICTTDENVISHCQIIDYENNHIYDEHLYKLLNYNNMDDFHKSSYIFTILNLNQQNKILLSYLEENSIDLSIINLSTKDFSSYDIIQNSKRNDDLLNSHRFSYLTCFITELKFIECIILHANENQLIVEIYDESLSHLDSIVLSNVELLDDSLSAANCIHLKNEIGVNNNPSPLHVQINKLVFDGSHYIF